MCGDVRFSGTPRQLCHATNYAYDQLAQLRLSPTPVSNGITAVSRIAELCTIFVTNLRFTLPDGLQQRI